MISCLSGVSKSTQPSQMHVVGSYNKAMSKFWVRRLLNLTLLKADVISASVFLPLIYLQQEKCPKQNQKAYYLGAFLNLQFLNLMCYKMVMQVEMMLSQMLYVGHKGKVSGLSFAKFLDTWCLPFKFINYLNHFQDLHR